MAQEIFFEKTGSGMPVILIHGFPMNSRVWHDFAKSLSTDFTVYTPDLPGFGKSPLVSDDFSLSQIAAIMNEWTDLQEIKKPCVIGHSMGGYVALEMVRQHPEKFSGLGLFHSTAMADNEEKKESRTKVVKFIEENGVLAFTSNFIQPLFADANHPAISFVKAITMEASADAVSQYTVAMRDRRDNQEVLQTFTEPILLIGGDKDKGIPSESLVRQAKSNDRISLHVFENTGHMGMFERPQETVKAVRSFLRKIYEPDEA